jgi:tetratricopeptide (TPR) repeat protein
MSLHRNGLPYILSNIIYPYLETRFIEETKNYIEEFLRLDGDSVRYYYQLSEIETLTANYNNAIEYLKKAYAIDSNYISTSVLFVLGYNYMCLHRHEEALKYFKECIEKDTTMHVTFLSEYNVNIGWSFWQSGYKEKAQYYLNKQIEISNRLIELGRSIQRLYDKYLDLALVYAVMGEKEKAYKNLAVNSQKQEMSMYDVNMFRYSPLFDNLRNDQQVRKILRDVESKYQTVHEKMRKWLEEQGEL